MAKLMTALNHADDTELRIALNFELPEDGSVPEWIEILPAGVIVTGRDGRTWINDNPQAVIDAFATGGKDLPIDWEHSTELKAPQGEPAPAAGWIKDLKLEDGGRLLARVEWTPAGRLDIERKAYRYISPVLIYELESRRVVAIRSVGLTNSPNLYLNALNHEGANHKGGNSMNLAELLAALGMPATATWGEALNRIGEIKSEHATALNQAQNPSLDKFVPRADYAAALNRAETAETALKQRAQADLETAINSEVDAALAAGKVTPATAEYHKAQCRQEGGLERFKDFVKVVPAIGDPSKLDGKQPPASTTALNAEERAVAGMFGNSAEDIAKYGKRED